MNKYNKNLLFVSVVCLFFSLKHYYNYNYCKLLIIMYINICICKQDKSDKKKLYV